MERTLAYYGNPILRKKGSPVKEIDQSIRVLIEDMFETMDRNDGCGLAAPQINESLLLFITCIPRYDENDVATPGTPRVFINPKIMDYSEEQWTCSEGCLSIPEIREEVTRPMRVTIQAMDLNGQIFTEEFTGFDAHVIMHENDHINGILYIDRLSSKKKKEIEPKLKAIKKKYNPKR